MPLVSGREQMLRAFRDAEARRWVLPAFNCENLTTLEAILAAAAEHAARIGRADLPIMVGITVTYAARPQAINYTHTRDWRIGLRLFLAELDALTGPDSPFGALRVLVHLDHAQWDTDAALLASVPAGVSSVMFDASALPLSENIRHTRNFVAAAGDRVLVEGACSEIPAAGELAAERPETPAEAERFARETGVDLIVADLGTEHRASVAQSRYRQDMARAITGRVGPRLCLHGASSVPPAQLRGLFDDGVRRVNLWTTLERDSAAPLMQDMLVHAAKVAGAAQARAWLTSGLLGPGADRTSAASIAHFTTAYRQEIVFRSMKRMVKNYLELWYV